MAERGEPAALPDGEPQAVTLRVARQDGATEVVDRRVVFLVRSGEPRAGPRLDLHAPRLPHALQCRSSGIIECPCHGGVYDVHGPGRLGSAAARARRTADAPRRQSSAGPGVGRDRRALLDWLDSRTGYRAGLSHLLDERLPQGTGWAFTTGSVVTLAARRAGRLGRGAGDVLRAVAGAGLRQRAVRDARTAHGMDGARAARLGRQLPRRRHGGAHAAGVHARRLQGAARGDVAHRPGRRCSSFSDSR